MTNEKKQEFTLRVSQANKTEMLVIIYDIFLEYLEDARSAKEMDDKEAFNLAIRSCRKCVQELVDSLHFEYELAAAFLQIYLYLNRELVTAETKFNVEAIDNIIGIVKKLGEAYKEASKTDKSPAIMGNTQQVYAGLTYGRDSLNESMGNPLENRGFRV